MFRILLTNDDGIHAPGGPVDGSVEKLGTVTMSGEMPANLEGRSPSRG